MNANLSPQPVSNILNFASPATRASTTPPKIKKVVIVGAGNLVRNRLLPALTGMKLDLALCGLETTSPLKTIPHQYLPVRYGTTLAVDLLDTGGFGGPNTLVYVATPSKYHISYGHTECAA